MKLRSMITDFSIEPAVKKDEVEKYDHRSLALFILETEGITKTHKESKDKPSVIHEIRRKLGLLEDNAREFCDFYKGYPHHNGVGFISGAVYIRWGRTTCLGNGTKLMYSGYAGGSQHNIGGAANYLCLPTDPTWKNYKDGVQHGGAVYGSEYQIGNANVINKGFHDKEVPCAVCQSSKRYSVYMIPGRNICYEDWHLEYSGYLMSDHYSHKSSEYVCLDGEPEVTKDSSNGNENGRLFYPVEARCGSLKCPPYVEGRELTCAVCTR